MKAPRRICVVTGTRADYGLLHYPMREIAADPALRLQIVATGMHLSPRFGLTYKAIEADGFQIDAKVDIDLAEDTALSTSRSVGKAVAGFAEAFQALAPDFILVLGDRFEILAAAQAALFARLPLAHIAGGDVTEGAFDEAIRHSITKMAHLHFVTNAESGRRVRQLGENPERIHNVGSPGIDFIKRAQLMDRAALEQSLGMKLEKRAFVVTFHPVTLESEEPGRQITELLAALSSLDPETSLIFTKPNADPGNRSIIEQIEQFTASHANSRAFDSLGQIRYLSLLRECSGMIGNSSSGLYEMPSFQKPTVNIGDRQKGRLASSSVISCACERNEIREAIDRALKLDCSGAVNPYGSGDASRQIAAILREIEDPRALIRKTFFDLRESK